MWVNVSPANCQTARFFGLSIKGFWLQKFWFIYREKKKELEREELWKKLEELKLKKALEKQNSAYNMHSILSNTSDE